MVRRRRPYYSRYRAPRPRRKREIAPSFVIILSLLALAVVLGVIDRDPIRQLVAREAEPRDYILKAELLDRTVDITFAELGVAADLIRRRGPDKREGVNGPGVIEKRVTIPADLPLILCNLELTKAIRGAGGKVFRAVERPRGGSVQIDLGVEEVITQKLILTRSDSLWRKTGKIAIIIDDLGYDNPGLTTELLEIEQPLTLAVLPGLKSSKKVAELAYQQGHEVIVHLPMEPHNYPKENPGPEAILIGLSEEEIKKRVDKALEGIPHARGLNNHMGSKATEDERVMGVLLREVRDRGLYFVDSRTSVHSLGYRLARQMGVKASEVEVPLDNVPEAESIRRQVEEMVRVATEQGVVLARGHVQYPETVQILKETLPALEKRGYQFIPVSRVVERR